jgi:hypothetical protein
VTRAGVPILPGDPSAPLYRTAYSILCARCGVSPVLRQAGVYRCGGCRRAIPERLLVS